MSLSPYGKMLLGAVIVGFGIAVVTDFSLLKASLYLGAVFLSVVLFL